MTNKKIGSAQKGSRFCLQEYIKKDKNKLSEIITGSSLSLIAFLGEIKFIIWGNYIIELKVIIL